MVYSTTEMKAAAESIAASVLSSQEIHKNFLSDPVSHIEKQDPNILQGVHPDVKKALGIALQNSTTAKVPYATLVADPNGAACWSCKIGLGAAFTATLAGATVLSGGSVAAITAVLAEWGLSAAAAAAVIAAGGGTVAGLLEWGVDAACRAIPNTC